MSLKCRLAVTVSRLLTLLLTFLVLVYAQDAAAIDLFSSYEFDSSSPNTYASLEYSTCSKLLYEEGFSALQSDALSSYNYPGSIVWQQRNELSPVNDFDKVIYVIGLAWACVNGTEVNAQTVQADLVCVVAGIPKPPLALNQCVPFPTLARSGIYLAIGVPLFVFCWYLIMRWHWRTIHQLQPSKDDRTHWLCSVRLWRHHSYGRWSLMLSKEMSSQPNYNGSWIVFFLRLTELEHSFLCFFFLSPRDPYTVKWRALTFALEQYFAFSIQAVVVSQWYATGDDPASLSGSIGTIVVAMCATQVIRVILPVRPVLAKVLHLKERSCKKTALIIWLIFNFLANCILSTIYVYVTAQGGKQSGGTAPNPGAGFLEYSFIAYLAAIPYQFFIELFTPFIGIKLNLCCGNWLERRARERTDQYTIMYCTVEDPKRWNEAAVVPIQLTQNDDSSRSHHLHALSNEQQTPPAIGKSSSVSNSPLVAFNSDQFSANLQQPLLP